MKEIRYKNEIIFFAIIIGVFVALILLKMLLVKW
jgi:hypothetical protein